MVAKKKKSSTFIIASLLLVCLAAVIVYLAVEIFAAVKINDPETSHEAVESCRAKITKMLIDETLAFKYKNTKDIPFSELEINSWLKEKLDGKKRPVRVNVQLGKNRVTFSGHFNPFAKKRPESAGEESLFKPLQKTNIAFRIVTKPKIHSNRIFFEPITIVLGQLHVPPKLMPQLPNTLDLNPFEKKIRTLKEVRISDGSLLVTVYAD